MKNKIYSIVFSAGVLALASCGEKKESSSTVTISTTLEGDTTKMVRKEVIAIKENVNGKAIDLKSENGAISSLIIDGKEISKEDFKKYEDLTSPILKKLPTPPTPPSLTVVTETGDSDNIDILIENELKKDGFIKGDKVKYDFDLSQDALIINSKTQPNDMKDRYLKLFKDKTGKALGAKFHIKLQEDKK